jgi:integrase
MASISNINGKWRALIRRKGFKSSSKWFDTKAKAAKWAKDIEDRMDGIGEPLVQDSPTVAALIKKYILLRSSTRPISDSSTEHYTLKQLSRSLGDKVAAKLTVDDLLGWAQQRRDEGAGPYTVNCDLSKLGTVFRYATDGLPDVIGAARPKLSYLGLIGGGGLRERRPTEDEYTRLLTHFADKHGQKYADALEFAAVTAMRRGEICAIKFEDVDEAKHLVKVMRKHPRKGKTLEHVPLLGRAWDIVQSRPKDADGLIFPIHPQTLSKYFLEACRALSIPDLHFHDFRHEGASALFEAGWRIEQVALVTGHKSWANLKRYTNLKPESLVGKNPDTQPHHGSQNIVSLRPRKSAP